MFIDQPQCNYNGNFCSSKINKYLLTRCSAAMSMQSVQQGNHQIAQSKEPKGVRTTQVYLVKTAMCHLCAIPVFIYNHFHWDVFMVCHLLFWLQWESSFQIPINSLTQWLFLFPLLHSLAAWTVKLPMNPHTPTCRESFCSPLCLPKFHLVPSPHLLERVWRETTPSCSALTFNTDPLWGWPGLWLGFSIRWHSFKVPLAWPIVPMAVLLTHVPPGAGQTMAPLTLHPSPGCLPPPEL